LDSKTATFHSESSLPKPFLKLLGAHVGGVGEPGEVLLFKVLGLEADHVAPGCAVGLGVHVHGADACFARGRVHELGKGDGGGLSLSEKHHGAGASLQEEAHRGVAQVPGILAVEGRRRVAPQFVSDVLGHDRDLDPHLLEVTAHLVFEDGAERDLGQADVPASSYPMGPLIF